MPVSVVVGGQFGSEGKGKVALHIAKTTNAAAVVRVGGTNSGHTGIDARGREWIFRQLPASCLATDALVVLPAGSLIDPDILLKEISQLGLAQDRVIIDSHATVILPKHRKAEAAARITESIGSTASGTGAALTERISRLSGHILARDHPDLVSYTYEFVPSLLRKLLREGNRIVVEGTQGFGLSIWHGIDYPYATSRDTTAAGFISEVGLAPHDVDDCVLVLRSFPIRVGGNSGPLKNEIDWPTLAKEAGLEPDHVELTSATKRVRRVARFDPELVRRAVVVNNPHRIVLNHVDYIDRVDAHDRLTEKALGFVRWVESELSHTVDLVGVGPNTLLNMTHPQSTARRSNAGRS